jgi:hexosaminidase
MIDTSRHYLPISEILKTIDHMLYSKLNVLHWHIIDEDAFPMQVPSVPELSDFGHIGGVFSEADIKSVIEYAKIRGIRVVPEIDSPAHTQSWGRSDKYKEITLTCNGIYMGQFDPTLDLTWEVVNDVMTYVNNTF